MPAPNPTNLNLSFTAASLRPELTRIIAEQYLATGDWEMAKERILSANALQARTASSAVRLERELRQRLMTLTNDQLLVLAQATAEDRAAMAWLAACKHIQFAFEFAAEVLREKLAGHDSVLRNSDYETFVDNKSVSHPELARLTNSSKSKIRQVLLRMLLEAGLLGKGTALGVIQRPILSPSALQAITTDNPRWLAGFLVPDTEIGGL
ncbi:MAG TPA: DUF1819 family protein [Blastocatellia bacterium]